MRLVRNPEWGPTVSAISSHYFGFPYSESGIVYYASVFEDKLIDNSFGFIDDLGPCALVRCNISGSSSLSYFEFPIEIWTRDGLSDPSISRLARDIIGTLREASRASSLSTICVRTYQATKFELLLNRRLVGMGASPIPAFDAFISLSADDNAILSAFRSGHRQQVRWGQKNLELRFVDATFPDRALFDEFQNLHALAAGRITRPQSSWNTMFDLVSKGAGDLILAYWNSELVGGTLILDSEKSAFYASGAYRRELFHMPLTHYPLYAGICRARERGRSEFHLGEVGHFDPGVPEKERAIGKFKLGFSDQVRQSLVWSLPIQ